MSKQFYRFKTDDYSAASFTSFTKDYFGKIEDLSDYVEVLRNDSERYDDFANLISCFDRYIKGEHDITHYAAYNEVPLLVKAKCLGVDSSYLEKYKWEHIDTWGFPYNMKCKEAQSSHIWLSCHGEYFRCIRTEFLGLKYENTNFKYVAPSMLWGLPHQIEVDGKRLYNRLYVVEKRFKNRQEALNDIEKFKIETDPDFTEIINDIFGDG